MSKSEPPPPPRIDEMPALQIVPVEQDRAIERSPVEQFIDPDTIGSVWVWSPSRNLSN